MPKGYKPDKSASDSSITRNLKRKGFNDRYIQSYLRGWNMAKKTRR